MRDFPRDATCEFCRYGVDLGQFAGYECRRHAPVFTATGEPGHWPPVRAEWVCGDWERGLAALPGVATPGEIQILEKSDTGRRRRKGDEP